MIVTVAASPTPLQVISLVPDTARVISILNLRSCLINHDRRYSCPPIIRSLPVYATPGFSPIKSDTIVRRHIASLLASTLDICRMGLRILRTLRPARVLARTRYRIYTIDLNSIRTTITGLARDRPRVVSLRPGYLTSI